MLAFIIQTIQCQCYSSCGHN